MSKQVDERVVSMQFDNSHFEKNVQTTMSTLDKLKQKLNLQGASKGLENVNTAAKNVNMSGLASSVETVRAKFSALEVMGVTALANITNSAVNAGNRIISALTIDPVKTGLQEYETKMNAIQVIKANTRGKNTMDEITAALDDLNDYADKTIYNFAQMTSNIGKFTAQGLDVNEAKEAVKGMANLAAASGASAEDMARATYQMSQALSGTIKMTDWNSLRNANMATTELKNTLIDLAKVHGIAIDDMIAKEGSFEQTLSKGWLTGEMFTEAMNIYSGVYSDAELKAKGFTDSQIANFKELAAMAESAATEVKTFTQLWDVLKETAQSGWTQTWELIFGDFETAKKMFTKLQIYFSDIINGWSDARNTLLGGALKPLETWNKIKEKLNNSSGLNKVKEVANSIENVTDKLEYFQKVVNDVWRGDYKNSDTGRYELLEKAGYDHRVVQDLVNKGYQYKLRIEDIEESHKKFGLTMENTSESTEEVAESFEELTDEKLKDAGLTEAEIKLYRDLEKEANRTGITIQELIDKMSEKDGRTLLIESAKNAWQGLVSILKSVRDAWVDIFPPMTAVQLYSIISRINEFSQKLVVSDETAKKLKRTFKGLFAALDIVATVVGGPLKIAFKLLTKLLSAFHLDIFDVTASIGDAIVRFRDWIDETLNLDAVFQTLVPYVQKAAAKIKEWFNAIKESEFVKNLAERIKGLASAFKDWMVGLKDSERIKNFIEALKNAGKALKDWISGIKDADNIPKYILEGLLNGLKSGAQAVANAVLNLGKLIIDTIKKVLGIHSPSTEFIEIGKNVTVGFAQGIQNGASKVWEVIKKLGEKCISIIKNIDFGAVLTVVFAGGMLLAANKMAKALVSFSSMFDGLGEMFADIGVGLRSMFKNIGKSFKAKALERKSKAILNFALAIGILAASVYVLSKLDAGSLWGAVGAIAALASVIGILSLAISKLELTDAPKLATFSLLLVGIGTAFLMLSKAMKTLSGMSLNELEIAAGAMSYLTAIVIILIGATNLIGPNIDKIGSTLLKLSAALLILVLVVKQIAKLEVKDLIKGIYFMGLFGGFVAALMAASKLAGPESNKIGSMILRISAAMLLLVLVTKIISGMETSALAKGILVIEVFSAIIVGLMFATKLAGDNTSRIGSTILAIAGAMALMAFTMRIVSGMDTASMIKGLTAIGVFASIIAALIYSTQLAGSNLKRVGLTILAISVAIGILAGVSVLLGLVKTENLAKGIIAIGLLSTMVAMLIASTKNASDCVKNLIVITIAIGILAAAVAGLSYLDAGSALESAASLSILIASLSGALVILSYIGKTFRFEDIGLGVLSLTAMVAPMAAFIAMLAWMSHIDAAIQNAIALTVMMTAMTALLIPLSIIGGIVFLTSGAILLGVVALAAMAGPMAAFVGVLAWMSGVEGATQNAYLLIDLMNAMADILVKIAFVAPLAVIGVGALASLTGLMVGIGALAVAVGYIMEKFPALEDFIDRGLPILSKLSCGIGNIVGSLISGFSVAVASSLPQIGEYLSQFMKKVTPFIEGAKTVDEQVVKGIGFLSAAVIALTAAELINGISSFLQGGSSFSDLGTELSDFMKNSQGFINGASTLNADMLTGVKALAETILILTAADVISGISSILHFGSNNPLSKFGSNIGDLGTGLSNFANSLAEGGFDSSKVELVSNAAEAVKTLAEAANEIPNDGGMWGKIFGDNSLGAFSEQIASTGKALSNFITNIGTFGEEQFEIVKYASDSISKFAEAADKIPNDEGLWGKIFGDNSLASFGTQIESVGSNLSSFVTNIGTFGEEQLNTINFAAQAISILGEAAKSTETGFWDKLLGKDSLAEFSSKLPELGTNIASFATEAGNVDEESVNKAARTLRAMSSLAKIDISNAGSNFEKLGKGLVTFSKKMSDFSSNMGKIKTESISSAIDKIKELVSFASSIGDGGINSLNSLGESLEKVGEIGVKKFISAFTSSSAKSDVKKAASDLAAKVSEGIKAKEEDIKKAGKSLASKASSAIETEEQKNKFKSAGKYLGEGLVEGINAKQQAAYDAGYALGQMAVQGEKDGQQSKSPSKLTLKAGKWLGEGLIIGMQKMTGDVYKTGSGLGETATKTISSAISKVVDFVNSDIDSQPTIRPVLDLSDVESGASTINGMFTSRTLKVNADSVGTISASMNRLQNGRNSDSVVSAINGLRKDISEMPRNTYSINGLTYDDGSNVSDAVKTLVRATRIERRT